MVAAGELDAAVAKQVQVAFSAAAYYVWRSNAPITCYEPTLLSFIDMQSKTRLIKQADILSEMAANGNLDADVVAKAQAAIEQDITFQATPWEEIETMYNELVKAADSSYRPSFGEFGLTTSPETAEAARFLVELLSEEPN